MPLLALQMLEKKIERRIRLLERKSGLRFLDEVAFIRHWIDKPLSMGAVTPSGKVLARAMARCVDPDSAGPVIELGSGTGAVTKALVERGIDPSRLVLVEFNPSFCRLLRTRYPDATVIQGDAYRIQHLLGGLLQEPAAAVVSGLPLTDQAVQAADQADRRSLRTDGARRAVRAVHLRDGDADPEAPRGCGACPRADLAEPAAGAGVGLSQELTVRLCCECRDGRA